MNPSFETILTSWHDFYLLVGTGAFTLIGLMFVAVTFGAHLIDEKNMPIARAFLDPTILHFVQVLVISGIVLMPGMGTDLFGGLLTGVGVLSLIVLVGVKMAGHSGLTVGFSYHAGRVFYGKFSGFVSIVGHRFGHFSHLPGHRVVVLENR